MHRSSGTRNFLAAALTLLPVLWGCGGSDLTLPRQPGVPTAIATFRGDDQAGTAGAPLPDSIVVKVTDDEGNPVSGQRVIFVLADESPGSLLTPDEALTRPDGTAAARWVLGGVSGTQRVVARLVSDQAAGALEARFTASATLPPANADRLEVRTQPSTSATAGTPFDRQPVIQIRDADGNDVERSAVPVTAAVASGNGALGGTTTRVTDSNGRAAFDDLRIDGATGSHVLIFAAGGYTSVTANPIEVRAAPTEPPPSNRPPTAVNDRYDTIEGSNHTLRVNAANGVLRNDVDPDGDQLTASMTSEPSDGTVTLEPDGSFSYTPESAFFGEDRFSYRASDGSATSSATVTIDVASVNDSPRFRDRGDESVKQNSGPREISGWATGISPGAENEADQTLTFQVTNDNTDLFTADGQPSVVRQGETRGTLRFEPAPGRTGSARVTVVLKDNGGTSNRGYDTSDPHTFTITVRP